MAQSQISRTLREEASVSRVVAILSRESFESRSALGRRVCEEFSSLDARGRPQLAGCMKALADLAGRVPDIVLPPPKAPAADSRPRIVAGGVPEPDDVPSHPARIEFGHPAARPDLHRRRPDSALTPDPSEQQRESGHRRLADSGSRESSRPERMTDVLRS